MQPQENQATTFLKTNSQRRVLLVVGKMGQGKSSFIRSLMTPQGSKKLITQNVPLIKGGQKSTTLEPTLYQIDKSHNLTGDGHPLYVLDTEGLDSQTATSLILQEIDTFVQQYRLVIAGIAYIVGGRQEGKDGSSFLKDFLRILKLKPMYKKHLFFCVHTNWFKAIYDGDCQEKAQSLQQFLTNLSLPPQVFQKTVFWDSGANNPKGYQNFIKSIEKNGEYNTSITQQWIRLRQNLSSQITKICPLNQYNEYYLQFWNKLKSSIQSIEMAKFSQYSWEKSTFVFQYFIQSYDNTKSFGDIVVGQAEEIGKGVKAVVKNVVTPCIAFAPKGYLSGLVAQAQAFFTGPAIAVQLGEVGAAGVAGGATLGGAAMVAGIAAGALGLLFLASCTIQYCRSIDSGLLFQKGTNAENEKMMEQKLRKRIKLIQKSMIYEEIIASDKIVLDKAKMELILIKKLPNIERIQVFQELSDTSQLLGQLNLENPLKVSVKYKNTIKLHFRVHVWTLTLESFNKIYMPLVEQFYAKQ